MTVLQRHGPFFIDASDSARMMFERHESDRLMLPASFSRAPEGNATAPPLNTSLGYTGQQQAR